MKRAGDTLVKFGNNLLNNRRDALIYVSVFAMLPLTAWLAVSLVALITLRKGKEAGFNILMPAMVAYLVSLITVVKLDVAIINVLITFIPAFVAACCLRIKGDWSWVFGAFILQSLIGVFLLQCLASDAIVAQYQNFQVWMSNLPSVDQLIAAKAYLASWDQLILANLFLGIQVLSITISATVSLLFARFLQSKLFMPGGFKKELATFRSGKLALILLCLLFIASYFNILLAMNVLPLFLFYFLLSGINLSLVILAHKKKLNMILLIFSLIISPFTMFAIFCLVGVLDSLFNFRMYFFANARKSI